MSHHPCKLSRLTVLIFAAVSAVFAVWAITAGFFAASAGVISEGIHSAVISFIVAAAFLVPEKAKKRFVLTAVSACFAGLIFFGLAVSYVFTDSLWTHRIEAGGMYLAMAAMASAAWGNAAASQNLLERAAEKQTSLLAAAVWMRIGAWTSAVVLTGLAVTKVFGWMWVDSAVSCFSAAAVLFSLFRTCFGSPSSPLDALEERRIGRIILDIPGVQGYHRLQGRVIDGVTVLSFHLEVDKDLPSYKACAVSDAVEFSLCAEYGPCDLTIRVESR